MQKDYMASKCNERKCIIYRITLHSVTMQLCNVIWVHMTLHQLALHSIGIWMKAAVEAFLDDDDELLCWVRNLFYAFQPECISDIDRTCSWSDWQPWWHSTVSPCSWNSDCFLHNEDRTSATDEEEQTLQTKVHWWKNKRKNRMHLTVITWRLLEHNTHHTHSRIICIYSDIKDTNAKNYTFIWELLIKEIHENHAEIQEITRSEWVSKRREKCKCNCNQSFVDQRSFRCVPGNTS